MNRKASIAYQCPMIGGRAVFRARSLYAFFDPFARYNDRETCIREGSPLRQTPKEVQSIEALLYPNPANTEVTLKYDLGEHSDGHFRMFNAQSQQVLQFQVFGKIGTQTFRIDQLVPGVYFYHLTSNGVQVNYGKLVVIR